jgi:hypothetical protein
MLSASSPSLSPLGDASEEDGGKEPRWSGGPPKLEEDGESEGRIEIPLVILLKLRYSLIFIFLMF